MLGVKKNVWDSTGFNDFVNVTRSLRKHDDSAGTYEMRNATQGTQIKFK